MPDFAITGKKGNGKSLVAVARMKEYLDRGLPVATNLDLNLVQLLGKNNKSARVIRLPDKPSGADLAAIGVANKSANEEFNGILVLDELATWINSRTHKDGDRQSLINWLVQARKDGWDCYYLVQEVNMVDKQVREGLFEHVAHCRRMDRLTIPFVSLVVKMLTGKRLTLPRVHIAFVKYGDGGINSVVVDRWVYRGNNYFSAYDTKQKFRNDYPHGPYSYLPPWYTHGRFKASMTRENIMRVTKILWRKWSRPGSFIFGFALASLFFAFIIFSNVKPQTVTETVNTDLIDILRGAKIVGYSKLPGKIPVYRISYDDGKIITTPELFKQGYVLSQSGSNSVVIAKGGRSVAITR